MIHDLKILPEYFELVKSGVKTFEVRRDDRNYQQGDILILREFDKGQYTGQMFAVYVSYILRGEEYCKEGYCIMSIKLKEWR